MRSVLSDIINADSRFHVEDRAADGMEALEILKRKTYDAVVLDCKHASYGWNTVAS